MKPLKGTVTVKRRREDPYGYDWDKSSKKNECNFILLETILPLKRRKTLKLAQKRHKSVALKRFTRPSATDDASITILKTLHLSGNGLY